MTVHELVLDLKAARAAERQYRRAQNRMAERGLAELRPGGKQIRAAGYAEFANRLVQYAHDELEVDDPVVERLQRYVG